MPFPIPTCPSRVAHLALLSGLLAGSALAQGNELLHTNPSNSSYTAVESYVLTTIPFDREAADDFDAVGTVERVTVHGKPCFPCSPADVASVTVRFYEHTAAGPGALLSQQVLHAGDPRLVYDPTGVDDLELTLPEPFAVDGQGYLSVQIAMGPDSGYWAWWISNKDAPSGSRLWWRNLNDGPGWGAYEIFSGDLVADLAFSLYGTGPTPPGPSTDPCGQWGVLSTPSPAGAQHAILRDVAAIDDDDVWAVGNVTLETSPGEIDNLVQAFHWDGVRWSEVAVPVPSPFPGGDNAHLTAVAAAASDDAWAAGTWTTPGDDGIVRQEVLIVHWDGSGWEVVPNAPLLQPGVSGAWVRAIEIISPDDIWFVGDFPIVTPIGSGVNYAGAIHWDGRDFEVFDVPLNNTEENGLSGVSAVASDDVWAVGGRYADGLIIDPYIVHFDGTAWELVPAPQPGIVQNLFDVVAIATDDVWAVGQTNTGAGMEGFALHWDGTSWSEVPFSGGSRALHAFASDDVYAVGGVVSHWDGATWSVVEDFDGVLSASMGGVDASAPCKLFAVGRQSVGGDLLNAAAKLDADPWIDLGGASVPPATLTGAGNLESGSVVELHLTEAPVSASATLVLGLGLLDAPFKGATLVPTVDVLVAGLPTNAFGRLDLQFDWPEGLPLGSEVYLQIWTALSGSGFVASNGLLGVTP